MVKNSGRIVPLLTILYIYTPIALFLFGWTKLWIACSCCIALAFSIRGMLKDFLSGNYAGDDDAIVMKTSAFAISTLFLLLVGYYAGWGRWVEQSSDWQKHNLILMDLTQGNWPVYYSTGDGHSMLSYYIAQYLLPALAGKCLHSVRLAEIANYVWAEIGLILVYLNLVRVTKARRTTAQFAAAFILVLFSPPVVLAKFVRWLADSGMDLAGVISGGPWFINEKAGLQMQYSGNFVLLRWVFPQAIVPWLTMLLFLEHRRKIRHYMTLFVPNLLFATLPLLGMIPLAAAQALAELFAVKKPMKWIKDLFSPENVLTFCGLGMVSILYLYGNVSGTKPAIVGFRTMPYGNRSALYFIFVGICVLPYLTILIRDNWRNTVFHASILVLCILPLFRMGLWNDLTMRSSIPALFVVMSVSLQYLLKHIGEPPFNGGQGAGCMSTKEDGAGQGRFSMPAMLLCILLAIGAWYPLYGFVSGIRSDNVGALGNDIELGLGNESRGSLGTYADRRRDEGGMAYNYFSYDIERDFFYRHIARTRLPTR